MKPALIFLCCLAFVTCWSGCSEKTPEPKHPIEYQLAVINADGYVDTNDITVSRFRYLLGNLSRTTGYDQEKIANIVVKTSDILKEEYGRKVSPLELMEAANKSETILNGTVKLESYLALYSVFAGQ